MPSLSTSRRQKADSTTCRSARERSLQRTEAAQNSLKSRWPEQLMSRTEKMSSMVEGASSRLTEEEIAATNSDRESVPDESQSIDEKMARSSCSWCGCSVKVMTSRTMRVSRLAADVVSSDCTRRGGRCAEVEEEEDDEQEVVERCDRAEADCRCGCLRVSVACCSQGCCRACEAERRLDGSFWMSDCTKSIARGEIRLQRRLE
mmetsp:Transcript_28525/g.61350  ORF Transcript_28525/g.61350 Transcript_28525/m.61350 type:complete len:204 (-) Transcript_28525:1150-1761(-)